VKPSILRLWKGPAPGAKGDSDKDVPAITPFLPPKDKATGAAVIVCPGGGYGTLAGDYEGADVARWLNKNGVAGFVLRYRHAPDYQYPAPLLDAQRAIRTVRARASDWGLDPDRIGILGFSAGGHLAATTGTLPEAGDPDAKDPIEHVSSRPDFMILVYPVITMLDPYAHAGSRRNLIGANPEQDLIDKLSAERQVTSNTPPAFLVASSADKTVPVQNTVMMYLALVHAGVSAEMHVYDHGNHGFGLGGSDPALSTWPGLCITWMKGRAIIK